ncbi:Inactive Phospholipase C-Like Protein 1 [Manis pentadactyla]|nr:Inactive Phospholipase C-Like Protein 1 [Manis pentadactyla]
MREPVNPGNSTPPGAAGTFRPAPSDHLRGEPTPEAGVRFAPAQGEPTAAGAGRAGRRRARRDVKAEPISRAPLTGCTETGAVLQPGRGSHRLQTLACLTAPRAPAASSDPESRTSLSCAPLSRSSLTHAPAARSLSRFDGLTHPFPRG